MTAFTEHVKRKGNVARVKLGAGHYPELIGKTTCRVENTGSGYKVKFPALRPTYKEHLIELDYSEVVSLINALAMFKTELGFAEDTK